MHEFCIYLDWAGLGPQEWATWIQVGSSIAALVLALYVPVRMRRLQELDHIDLVINHIRSLNQLCADYVLRHADASKPLEDVPSQELQSAKRGCEEQAKLQVSHPRLAPLLQRAAVSGGQVIVHWQYAANGATRQDNPLANKAALARQQEVEQALIAAKDYRARWKRRHWLALLLA